MRLVMIESLKTTPTSPSRIAIMFPSKGDQAVAELASFRPGMLGIPHV